MLANIMNGIRSYLNAKLPNFPIIKNKKSYRELI